MLSALFCYSMPASHSSSMSFPTIISQTNPLSLSQPPQGNDARHNNAHNWLRGHFPYFNPERNNPVFMENAGGSQCPEVVIDSIADYMKNSYVQLGAGYTLSDVATSTVARAHAWMKVFMNVGSSGEVVFGSSTSQLLAMLSHCYEHVLQEGDEVIVHEANHEANAGPWVRMAEKKGLYLKFWKVDYETFESSLESLTGLLSSRTRIVAVTHVSNLLGKILDLEKIVNLVKEKAGPNNVRLVVDGVAYAPHRAIDVAKWGVDWYAFSSYKVYGPHMAVLFGTHASFLDIKEEGPNFYFIPSDDLSHKFELGCLCHEACAGLLALPTYLRALVRVGEGGSVDLSESWKRRRDDTAAFLNTRDASAQAIVSECFDRTLVDKAFDTVSVLEEPLQTVLLSYLSSRTDIVIIGSIDANISWRLPIICFVHKTKRSSEIAKFLQREGFAVRHGHLYSHRIIVGLCTERRLFSNSIADGVVRVSMLHYNTPNEVASLISCLESVLK